MKEYTLLAFVSVLMTFLIDKKSGINVLQRREFYWYLLVIFLMKFLVNGYLTGAGIVLYRSAFFLGWRIGSIPAEDFLFGFSLVTLTIIFFEFFKKRA